MGPGGSLVKYCSPRIGSHLVSRHALGASIHARAKYRPTGAGSRPMTSVSIGRGVMGSAHNCPTSLRIRLWNRRLPALTTIPGSAHVRH
jgi:hypothetical protein